MNEWFIASSEKVKSSPKIPKPRTVIAVDPFSTSTRIKRVLNREKLAFLRRLMTTSFMLLLRVPCDSQPQS